MWQNEYSNLINNFFSQMQTYSLMLWFTLMMSKSRHQNCIISLKKVGTICHVHEQFTSLMLRLRFSVQASAQPTMLIVVICVSFIVLICGITIARIRSNSASSRGAESMRNGDKHMPVKVSEGVHPSNFERSLTPFVFHVPY